MDAVKRLVLVFPVLLVLVFFRPGQAYAWFVDFGWRNHHDKVFVHVPVGSTRVVVRGRPYYYYQGDYYWNNGGRVEVCEPPEGAIVRRIPHDYRQTVWIRGHRYFRSHGVYYIRVAQGYQVVNPPVIVENIAVPVQDVVVEPAAGQQVFKINIPNFNSGYTTVTITRQGTGFVGPQGEYYDKFPTVEQLRLMYGK